MLRFSRLARATALLLALAAMALPAWADAPGPDSPQSLIRFFQSQPRNLPASNIDFQVTAGFAVIATGTPESSGRYAMTAINVTKVANDIYRLDLSLEKPMPRDVPTTDQPYFFVQKRTYYFWYQNGDQIVFKVGGKKVSLATGRKDVLRVDIHSPDTYSIDRETMLKNLTFDDGPAKIVLQIKFN